MNKIFSLMAGLALCGSLAYAVPAKPGLRTVVQPDGTTVQVELRGDEYCSFYVDAAGRPMRLDSEGYLRFVVPASEGIALSAQAPADSRGSFEALGRVAAAERVRTGAVSQGEVAARVAARAREAAENPTYPQTGLGLMTRQTFPLSGTVRSVVILVSYSDVDFTVENPHEYYYRHLNEDGFSDYGSAGSCRQFFVENSMEQFVPEFDVFGPVQLSKTRSYYGADSGTRHDVNAAQMISEACVALDSEIDYSQYDLDGDGYVDNVYVIYAGQGQASYGGTETIWPHSNTLVNGPVLDGIRIGRYACSNEWEDGRPDGVGTFIHEFSHVLGLPDLYDVTYMNDNITPGAYDTMDQGPYNHNGGCPPYYSSFERNALGWADLTLIDGPASADLAHIGASNQAYLIQTMNPNEFYLLENRQQVGWDRYIPGHGLLVWHIDFDESVFTRNAVNTNASHQYVDIVEANATSTNNAGHPFPGTAFVKQREISPDKNTLTPWFGPIVPYYITEIYERTYGSDPRRVSFLVDGGLANLDAPVATEFTNPSANGFTANWNAVEGASGYALTVYAEQGGNLEPLTLPFGEETDRAVVLPEGWEFTGASNDVYTTASFCGAAIPSLKFNGNGIILTSPLFEAEITGMSFFLRAGAVKENSMLVIEGRNDAADSWKRIDAVVDLTVVNTRGDNFTVDCPDAHVRQVRFIFYSANGKLGMDDLSLTFGDCYRAVYLTAKTTDALSADVAVAAGDPLKFTYVVKALDSKGVGSVASNEIHVDLSPYAGVDNVIAGKDCSFAVAGRTVTYTGTAGATVSAVNLAGLTVATVKADSNGVAVVELPAPGFYVLAAPQATFKTMVK